MSSDVTKGPCTGIRVADFTTMVAGAMASQLLGDLGAEVVKVEPPSGEPMRHVGPFHEGLGAAFLQYNRNKVSVALDLKAEDGKEIALKLVRSADVVIENARPGVMDRLGLGYAALAAENPRLVYVSISGFGPTGPYAKRPAYDQIVQGLTGVMYGQGRGRPEAIRNPMADKVTAIWAASAAVSALLFRERSGGVGQKVSVSLLDAFATFALSDQILGETFRGDGAPETADFDPYHTVKTRDGHVIGNLMTDDQFVGACRTFGLEGLIDDPRFRDTWGRARNTGALWEAFGEVAQTWSTAELVEAAANADIPLGPVNDIQGFFDDPQVRHNGTYFDREDPEFGVLRMFKYPVDFEKSPARSNARAPRLGEHSDDVLRGLGLADADIERLRARGVVR